MSTLLLTAIVLFAPMFAVLMFVNARTRSARRHVMPNPPQGTRPVVLMEYDGVRYDLTEALQNLGEDARGDTVWAIHGPLHLRLSESPDIRIMQPIPVNTRLWLNLIGDPEGSRFATAHEIEQRREEILRSSAALNPDR